MRNYRELTAGEVQQMAALYPVTPNRELSRRFDVSVDAIVDHLARPLGWQKDRSAMSRRQTLARYSGTLPRLSAEQEAWIVKHYKHTTNPALMQRFGIGESELRRVVRKYGLRKSPQQMRKTQQAASQRGQEACLEYGVYDDNAARQRDRWAAAKAEGDPNRYGWQPGETQAQRFGTKRWRQMRQQANERRNKTIRSDRIRIHFGLEPRTKLVKNYSARPDWHPHHYRYALRKRGYLVEPSAREAYYDGETRRSAVLEENASRWGIRCLPIED